MIIFQTLKWQWDLTNKGISFNEDSDFFSDKISKSYTFPLTTEVDDDTAERLELVTIDGVISYQPRIYGHLILDNNFYDGYIQINNVKTTTAELTIFYGKETLSVFDKKLPNLPFPAVIATPDLPTFALAQIDKAWPEATHNFVKVMRDEIKTKTNYEFFENFMNNTIYDDEAETWSFVTNSNETVEGVENVAVNRNVMCPMTYLIEVLRVGFKTEGLDIRGDFVNDAYNHKIVMIPKNFMEKFAASQYEAYSFSAYTIQETIDGVTYNVYRKSHTPTDIGSFSLKMKVNFSNVMAQSFSLVVSQNGVVLYQATSQNTQVNINETLDINIVSGSVFNDIDVEMRLLQQTESILAYNSFTYEYKEANLNIFPLVYTLSDYLPNITFRDLINKIKTWLNLKFDYTDNAVYINYLENYIVNIPFHDKSHLQDVDAERQMNTHNLFKLTYPDEQTVLVDKTGQTYNESDYIDAEIETIDIDVLPLQVRENYRSITAIYPEDEADIMLTLYNSTVEGENIAVDGIANRKLTLQHIYDRHWSRWLKFRANAESYKDSFYMHYSEALNIKEGIFKYNKHHLMLSIRKKRVSEEYWKVDVESETF